MELFPEIGLSKTTLINNCMISFLGLHLLFTLFLRADSLIVKKLKWEVPRNRRLFFENYAKENGFNPLLYKNWLLQSRTKIKNSRVCEE